MSENPLFIAAVSALIFKENKLLTMKRSMNKTASPGVWEALSGRLNPEEDPYEGVLREIEEESGLVVDVEPRPIDAYMAKRCDQNMILLVYRAKYISGEVLLSEEHDEYAWSTIEEFELKTPLKRLVEAAKKAVSDNK